jgi:hypothetical protein
VSALAQPERASGPASPPGTASGTTLATAGPGHGGDALPVLAEGPVVSEVRSFDSFGGLSRASSPAFVPAMQAAAAAAGGFLAGAAVIGLVNRRHRRADRLVRRPRAGRAARGRGAARGGELVQIVGIRSLLVDVHLLAER